MIKLDKNVLSFLIYNFEFQPQITNKLKPLSADFVYFDGILQKGPYPPCLRMSDRARLVGYPRFIGSALVALLADDPTSSDTRPTTGMMRAV